MKSLDKAIVGLVLLITPAVAFVTVGAIRGNNPNVGSMAVGSIQGSNPVFELQNDPFEDDEVEFPGMSAWNQFVNGLRASGYQSFAAVQGQDKIVDTVKERSKEDATTEPAKEAWDRFVEKQVASGDQDAAKAIGHSLIDANPLGVISSSLVPSKTADPRLDETLSRPGGNDHSGGGGPVEGSVVPRPDSGSVGVTVVNPGNSRDADHGQGGAGGHSGHGDYVGPDKPDHTARDTA